MPLDETVETFSYFISEIDKLKIGYLNILRYVSDLEDPEFNEKKQHDVIKTYAHLVQNAKLFVGGGYTGEEAATAVKGCFCYPLKSALLNRAWADGKIEGAFFGMAWITHPDLAKRFEHGKALGNQPDFMTLYGKNGGTVEEQKKGYIDYPPAQY